MYTTATQAYYMKIADAVRQKASCVRRRKDGVEHLMTA